MPEVVTGRRDGDCRRCGAPDSPDRSRLDPTAALPAPVCGPCWDAARAAEEYQASVEHPWWSPRRWAHARRAQHLASVATAARQARP